MVLNPYVSRRRVLKIGAVAIAGAVIANTGTYSFSREPEQDILQSWVNHYRDIQGFNYQPSYEATGYSIWRQFRRFTSGTVRRAEFGQFYAFHSHGWFASSRS